MCECDAHRIQKKESDPLVLDLEVVMSHQIQALGGELRSSARAIYALNL